MGLVPCPCPGKEFNMTGAVEGKGERCVAALRDHPPTAPQEIGICERIYGTRHRVFMNGIRD